MSETKTVRLGDIATIERKSVQPSMTDDGTFYLGLEHIQKGGRIIDRSTVGESQVKSSKFQFTENHILYGKLRPYLAKIASPGFSGVCSTDILPIKPGAAVDKDYLFYYLHQPHMVALANKETTGANLPRISPKALAALPIELPNIEQQKKLAEQYRLQDLIKQKRERQQELFDELERARFIEKYGNPITNPKNLPMVRLSDIATITTGNSPSRSNKENFGHHIEWIKSNNLGQKYPTEATQYLSEKGAEKARIAPPNSILVTCIAGSISSIGKCSITNRSVAFNQQINSITPHRREFSEYIWKLFRYFPNIVQSKSSGGMKRIVSKSTFESILIPLADINNDR